MENNGLQENTNDPGSAWAHTSAANVDTCIVCGEVGTVDEMHCVDDSDAELYAGSPGDLVCEDCQ